MLSHTDKSLAQKRMHNACQAENIFLKEAVYDKEEEKRKKRSASVTSC